MAPPTATFPEEYHIQVDDEDQKDDDGWNAPGYLQHSYSFQDWRKSVLAALTKISSTVSGNILLLSIKAAGNWIDIKPMSENKCNAHGLGWRQTRGDRMFYGVIYIDPQMFMSGSECYRKKLGSNPRYNRGSLPDEVLFHELIHAYRGLLRVGWDHDPLHGGVKRYTDGEEFYAVVLTNIYITDQSNRHSSGLRADHTNHHPLEKELSNSFTFYETSPQVLPLMDQMFKEMPVLAYNLVGVKATFNPLLAYFQNYHALKKLSHSPLATKREILIERLPLPIDPEATILETLEKYFERVLRPLWNKIPG